MPNVIELNRRRLLIAIVISSSVLALIFWAIYGPLWTPFDWMDYVGFGASYFFGGAVFSQGLLYLVIAFMGGTLPKWFWCR